MRQIVFGEVKPCRTASAASPFRPAAYGVVSSISSSASVVRPLAGVSDDGDAQHAGVGRDGHVGERRVERECREEQIDCRDHAAGEDIRRNEE